MHELTGQLFLRAADPARAVMEFETALRTNPKQSQWLEEAGKAAYAAGNYQKAETYLSKANRENPSDSTGELLETVRDVLRDDPYLSGLSDDEQARRSWRAFKQGLARLQSCTESHGVVQPPEPLPEMQNLVKFAKDMKVRVNLRSLGKDAGLRNDAMRLVFQIEEISSRSCGLPTGPDKALLLIGKEHQGGDQ